MVPIQGEIDDERMRKIQSKILKGVEDNKVKGVVIDVSGVRIIEPYHARIIDDTAKMVYLLGAKTVLTGIRPGVAISLTDSNFDFKEIYETARTFEDGVKKLQSVVKAHEEFELGFEEEEVEEEEEKEEEFEVEAEVEIKEEGEDNEEKSIEGKEEEVLD